MASSISALVALSLVAPLVPFIPDAPTTPSDLATPVMLDTADCEGIGCALWDDTFNGPGDKPDKVVDALADDGTVYVTGWLEWAFQQHDVVTAAYDLGTGEELWRARLAGDGNGVDQPTGLALIDDLLVVVGQIEGETSGLDALAVAYDRATGVEAWRVALDGAAGSHDVVKAVVASGDARRVYIAGQTHGAITQDDLLVAALDALTGEVAWRVEMDLSDGGVDEVTGLALRQDGSLVVAGVASGATTDALALAVDAGGAHLWTTRFDAGRDERANALAAAPDGTVYLAGKINGPSGFDNYLTVSLAADGSYRWNATYNGPSSWFDAAKDVAVVNGLVWVTGQSASSTNDDIATLAYHPNGTLAKLHRYNNAPSNNDDRAADLLPSADGATIYVAGGSVQTAASTDVVVLAIDAATNTTLWTSRYNGPASSTDDGVALALTGTGLVAVGTSRGSGTGDDFVTLALGADGSSLWTARLNGPADTEDAAGEVVLSPDGSVAYVAGRSVSSGNNLDVLALAYDVSTGERLWESRYNAPAKNQDWGEFIARSDDGSMVFVAGRSYTNAWDYLTVAIHAGNGTVAWTARYHVGGDDLPYDVGVAGNVVLVTGQSWGNATTRYDFATVAYDAATGAQLWAARENGANSEDVGHALAVSPDGARVAATGHMWRGAGFNYDYATFVYDVATGARVWNATYSHSSGTDEADVVAYSPDGTRVFVSGRSVGTGYDIATLAYDATNGSLLWLSRYSLSGLSDEAWGMAVSPDGAQLAVTGLSWGGSSGYDLTTLAYDSTDGSSDWVKRVVGPGNTDSGQHLVYAPDGKRLYATGYSDGSGSGDDWLTVAYDTASGNALWGARLNGPGSAHDYANGIAITPDGGRLVVSGRVAGSGTGYDMRTIVYAALVAPGAPTALAGVAGPGVREVSLSWSAPASDGGSPVLGYRVYRDGVLVETTTATGSVVSLPDEDAHALNVTAYNAIGEGAAASVLVSPHQAPSAPRDLVAAAGPGAWEITASWTAPASDGGQPVTGYRVYVNGAFASSVTGLSATLTVANASAHYIAVSAVNAVGEGPRANVSAAPFQLPGPVVGLTGEPGPGAREVTLSWLPPSDDGGTPVTEYRVSRDGAFLASTTETGFVDTLVDNDPHSYAVAAVNLVGEGIAHSTLVTPFQFPGVPTNVTAAPHGLVGEVQVSWAAPADDGGMELTAYHVERYDEDLWGWTRIATVDAGNHTHVDAGLMPLSSWRYRVVAENPVGEGAPSAEACATASPWPDPLPPCGVAVIPAPAA